MWLPLLGMFIWLAKVGSDEYQKLEAYKRWAIGFDRCKYDLYAVLGLKDREISWGKPNKKDINNLNKFSLDRVKSVRLVVDDSPVDLTNLPDKGKKINLQFQLDDRNELIDIPFTEIPLAAEWADLLQEMKIK